MKLIFAIFITLLSIVIITLPILIVPLLIDPLSNRLYVLLISMWFLTIGCTNQKIQSFLERLFE